MPPMVCSRAFFPFIAVIEPVWPFMDADGILWMQQGKARACLVSSEILKRSAYVCVREGERYRSCSELLWAIQVGLTCRIHSRNGDWPPRMEPQICDAARPLPTDLPFSKFPLKLWNPMENTLHIRRPRLQQGERVRGGITSSKGQEVITSSKGKKQENKKEEARSKKQFPQARSVPQGPAVWLWRRRRFGSDSSVFL